MAVDWGLRAWGGIASAVALMAQWIFLLRWAEHAPPLVVVTSAGIAIFGAAFLLSWAAEAAQIDIPPSLSFAFLAFIAVLPEYAVDLYFAWQAGSDPTYTQYATANMTGANRILIGAGWPLVVLAFWWKSGSGYVALSETHTTELRFLVAATLYSFVIPFKGTLNIFDSLILLAIFAAYLAAAARSGVVEPELGGPAETIGGLPTVRRRWLTTVLFAACGVTILAAAEPFAESLLEVGRVANIDEFILVQWVAPLASESPEFIVATLFALKLKPGDGFSTLLSSKVNQWTLLIGALPLAFVAAVGGIEPMILDHRQAQEIMLTAAQSWFAVTVLCDLRFGIREALVLLVLFSIQLAFPHPAVRMAFVWIYLAGSVLIIALSAGHRRGMARLAGVATR